MKAAAPIAMAMLLWATVVPAASPVGLLLIPFSNSSARPELGTLEDGMAELLTVCFSAYADHVAVVERNALDAVVREQSLSWERYVSQNSLRDIGKLANAGYILRGSFVDKDQGLQVQALLFDAATTQLVHTATGAGALGDLSTWLCKDIAHDVAAFLGKRTARSASLPIAEQPQIQRFMIEGMGHYYNGDFARAFPAFLKVLRAQPTHADAQYWLGKSFYGAGMREMAKIQFEAYLQNHPDNSKAQQAKQLLAGP